MYPNNIQRITQPQTGIDINWSNPLCRDMLTFATPAGSTQGPPTFASALPTRVSGKTGNALRAGNTITNATNYITFPSRIPPARNASVGITLYARMYYINQGSGVSTWTSARHSAAVELIGGAGGISITNDNTGICAFAQLGANRIAGDLSSTANKWYDVFAEVPNNSSSLGYVRLYIVGVGSVTSPTGATNSTFNTSKLWIGHSISTASPGDRVVECVGLWGRVLSDAEKNEIATNPYMLCAPVERNMHIWSSLPNPYSHPGLSAAMPPYYDLTSTTVRPRAAVNYPS